MRILFTLVLLVLAAPKAYCADFCALTVDILKADGSPANLTPMKFIDPAGKVISDETVEGPVLRICDFGFGRYKLVLGFEHCYPVAFENLRLRLDESIHLVARLNSCSADRFPGNTCAVYLRVRDSNGGPVKGAVLSWTANTPGAASDDMGRVGAFLVGGESTNASVSKEGFKSQTLSLKCVNSEDLEREVALEPH